MSYVIQSYFFNQKLNSQTPRSNLLLMFNNFNLVLLFIKYKLFFISFKFETHLFFNIFNKMIPHFYHFFYSNKVQKLDINHNGFYCNNVTKSLAYWSVKAIETSLLPQQVSLKTSICFHTELVSNQYFMSVSVLKLSLNLNKFKNFFFYNFFLLTFFWLQSNAKLTFYLNFAFSVDSLFLLPIFGGHFFKIYKY